MGRPPSNGGPSFRFSAVEVGEMDAILHAHNYAVPTKELLDALAQRFSASTERAGKMEVSPKQVWNWFQNRRYALRARAAKDPVPGQGNVSPMPQHDQPVFRNVSPVPQPQPQAAVRNAPQASQPQPAPPNTVKSVPQVIHPLPAPSVQNAQRNASDDSQMEFEAKSARDGAWYDVTAFLSHRSLETANPEALVRFAGFGAEEDEWVNIRRHVRQRSFPCESSECVAVLPGDLILCFQEGKEQALYFDAHVLDAQRRRHDVRGCRCRFLVRYDHDQAEEIVQLRKICRRPETFYRLEQLQALSKNGNQEKTGIDSQAGNSLKANASGATIQKQAKPEVLVDSRNTTRGAPANFTAVNEFSGAPANATATSAYGGAPTNATATSAYGGAPTNATATSTYGGTPANVTATSESAGAPANVYEANESSGAPANITAVSESSAAPANVSATSESSGAPANVYATNESSGAAANVSATRESTCAPANVFATSESSGAPANITAVSEFSAAPANITATSECTAAHANVSATNESSVAPASDTAASETKLPLSKN